MNDSLCTLTAKYPAFVNAWKSYLDSNRDALSLGGIPSETVDTAIACKIEITQGSSFGDLASLGMAAGTDTNLIMKFADYASSILYPEDAPRFTGKAKDNPEPGYLPSVCVLVPVFCDQMISLFSLLWHTFLKNRRVPLVTKSFFRNHGSSTTYLFFWSRCLPPAYFTLTWPLLGWHLRPCRTR